MPLHIQTPKNNYDIVVEKICKVLEVSEKQIMSVGKLVKSNNLWLVLFVDLLTPKMVRDWTKVFPVSHLCPGVPAPVENKNQIAIYVEINKLEFDRVVFDGGVA